MVTDDVKRFLHYGILHFGLSPEDALFAHNALLKLLGLEAAGEKVSDLTGVDQAGPDEIVRPLLDYALAQGCTDAEHLSLFETSLFGCLVPPPSAVIAAFEADRASRGVKAALDRFYEASIRSNYIKMRDVRKNIEWTAPADKADLVITVNLSKPEKDNKEIARLKSLPQVAYPKCMLCAENLGYAGRLNFPARQTLRFLPLFLGGEKWYLQFSPYVYYHQHCIAFSAEHKPMRIEGSTLEKLLDFVDFAPHYFIGSNADLPIVGGSILTHEHFQGGGYEMPLLKTPFKRAFDLGGVQVGIADWYNSVVRICGKDRGRVLALGTRALEAWRAFSLPRLGIVNSQEDLHNTVTPIARRVGKKYELNLILRNNITTSQYPDGLFHAHPKYHNIKKEGIGIIEAMGVFILPGRLQRQCEAMADILCGKAVFDPQNPGELAVHAGMLHELMTRHGCQMDRQAAHDVLRRAIDDACLQILKNTAVFKEDAAGQQAFDDFLQQTFKGAV